MQLFRVTNGSKYDLDKKGPWFQVDKDIFFDPLIAPLSGAEQLGWIAVLVAAKRAGNMLSGDVKAILKSAGLEGKHVRLNLEKFLELGLIELVDANGVIPAREKPQRKAAGSTTPKQLAEVDTDENRQGVDDVNEILSKKQGYVLDTLARFERLRSAGYTREDWRRVLVALRDKSTSSARFAIDGAEGKTGSGPGIDWALRTGEKGGFSRILEQASTGSVVVDIASKRKSAKDVLEEQLKRDAALEESNG